MIEGIQIKDSKNLMIVWRSVNCHDKETPDYTSQLTKWTNLKQGRDINGTIIVIITYTKLQNN